MAERVALVTGATSGIGEAVASVLGRRGWTVLVHGRCPEKCREVVDGVESAGGSARSYVGDFSSLAALGEMCRDIRRRETHIDLLVNNAGCGFVRGSAATIDGHDPVLQVNLIAPLLVIEALKGLMSGAGAALVVNMASIGQYPFAEPVSFAPIRNLGIAYGRSKIGLVMITRQLAFMLRPAGISLVAAHPGEMIATPLSKRIIEACPWPVRFVLTRKAKVALSPDQVAIGIADLADQTAALPTGAFLSFQGKSKIHPQADDERMSKLVLELGLQVVDPFLAEDIAADGRNREFCHERG